VGKRERESEGGLRRRGKKGKKAYGVTRAEVEVVVVKSVVMS